MAQNGTATTVSKMFSRQTSVSILIEAEASTVWQLLTQAHDYPRWNSTVLSIQGNIEKGEKIQLVSSLDPNQTFKLKIKEVQPEQRLVWGDAMGERVYQISPEGDGKVLFTMTEKIGGPMFPLFAKQIPSFDDSFEQFVSDLKKEAEGKP